ncbi:MAG: hypothetical protein PUB52_05040 [Lachnospiraceae bacterium]|nr:hypothetical protein [Lachnospiraceae bacterium]
MADAIAMAIGIEVSAYRVLIMAFWVFSLKKLIYAQKRRNIDAKNEELGVGAKS